MFPILNRKKERCHSLEHITISFGTKFQPKLTIFYFYDELFLKGMFPI